MTETIIITTITACDQHPHYEYYDHLAQYYGFKTDFDNFCETRTMEELSTIMCFFTGRKKKYLNNFALIVPYLKRNYHGEMDICPYDTLKITNYWKPYVLSKEQKYYIDLEKQKKLEDEKEKLLEYKLLQKALEHVEPETKELLSSISEDTKETLLNVIPRTELYKSVLVEIVEKAIFKCDGKSLFPYADIEEMYNYLNQGLEVNPICCENTLKNCLNLLNSTESSITCYRASVTEKYIPMRAEFAQLLETQKVKEAKPFTPEQLLRLAHVNKGLFMRIYAPIYAQCKSLIEYTGLTHAECYGNRIDTCLDNIYLAVGVNLNDITAEDYYRADAVEYRIKKILNNPYHCLQFMAPKYFDLFNRSITIRGMAYKYIRREGEINMKYDTEIFRLLNKVKNQMIAEYVVITEDEYNKRFFAVSDILTKNRNDELQAHKKWEEEYMRNWRKKHAPEKAEYLRRSAVILY